MQCDASLDSSQIANSYESIESNFAPNHTAEMADHHQQRQ